MRVFGWKVKQISAKSPTTNSLTLAFSVSGSQSRFSWIPSSQHAIQPKWRRNATTTSQSWHANPTQNHQLHVVDWTTLLGIEGHLLPIDAYSLHRWINKTIVKMKGKPWQASPSRFRTTSWSRPPLPHPKHGATASPPTPGNPCCPQPPPLALPRWPQPGAARAGWAPAQAQRRRKHQSLAPGQRVKRRKAWSAAWVSPWFWSWKMLRGGKRGQVCPL